MFSFYASLFSERVENQINIVAKKETAINQLREIARKYRSEAEALKKKDNESKLRKCPLNLHKSYKNTFKIFLTASLCCSGYKFWIRTFFSQPIFDITLKEY